MNMWFCLAGAPEGPKSDGGRILKRDWRAERARISCSCLTFPASSNRVLAYLFHSWIWIRFSIVLKINTWIRIRLNKLDKARVFANFLLENFKEISILKSGNTACEKQIHPFDNYVIWPSSVALMNPEPITLRNGPFPN